MDQAAQKTIETFPLRMADAVTSGDIPLASRVWMDFPNNLRSFRHDP